MAVFNVSGACAGAWDRGRDPGTAVMGALDLGVLGPYSRRGVVTSSWGARAGVVLLRFYAGFGAVFFW